MQESKRLPCGGRGFTPRQNDWNHCSSLPQGTLHTLCLPPFCEVPALDLPAGKEHHGFCEGFEMKNCRRCFPSPNRSTELKNMLSYHWEDRILSRFLQSSTRRFLLGRRTDKSSRIFCSVQTHFFMYTRAYFFKLKNVT